MLQGSVRREVSDQHDALSSPPGRQIGEEPRHPLDRLTMAFPSGYAMADPKTQGCSRRTAITDMSGPLINALVRASVNSKPIGSVPMLPLLYNTTKSRSFAPVPAGRPNSYGATVKDPSATSCQPSASST
jgi:hypothetical protein